MSSGSLKNLGFDMRGYTIPNNQGKNGFIVTNILYYDNFIAIDLDTNKSQFSLEEICKKGFKSSVVKKIRNLLVNSEYKRRQAPPGVKISVRSFGKERRYPITNQFKI